MVGQMRALAAVAAVMCAGAALAAGPAPGPALPRGETARVTQVVDGDTLVLANGLTVRLAEIDAPRREDPLGPQAQATLSNLALGKTVSLRYGGLRRDSRGRALAQVVVEGGPAGQTWLQREMLARGLARVHTWPDNRAEVPALFAAERAARAARAGVWAQRAYAVNVSDPAALRGKEKSFQLVEGTVTQVADRRGRIYVNFGRDYKTDFTVVVERENLRNWPGGAADIQALQGRQIRIRGWLKDWNGPMIEATHPQQIEFLRPAAAPVRRS